MNIYAQQLVSRYPMLDLLFLHSRFFVDDKAYW